MVERVDKPSINYRVDLNVDESELLDWDGAVSDELYAEAERVSPDSFGTVPRKNVKGRTVYAALQYELGTAKAASEWLAARGYKGIKYLDGGSRDVGVGTHNYVIFSGRDVKITGINASGDYGAAWEEMEPVESPVTFSVIGEKSKTWGRYKERAFEGRDDGKMRAEIDASKARVKSGIFGVDKVEEYRQLIAQRGEQRYNLGDVLDYEELYEAYPELRVRDVTFRKLEDGVRGRVESWGGISLAPELRFHEEELRSVLLHEVQHAVQRIEGFARGGNTEGVYDRVQAEIGDMNWELRLLEREMRFFEAPGQGRDYLRAALGFLRTPKRAVKRSGLAMALRRPGESVEETAERCVAELRRVYDELVEKDTEWLGLYVREQDEWRYAMPRDVDFGDEGAVARALRKVEGLPGRRSVARGVAPVKAREMKALVAKKWRFERLARDYRYEPFELYRRLAGEIEARGVQARLGMTAAERADNPFNETLEYPGEALVTFSVIGERAETWEKYKDRAFRGRDDGMLRAEIDASGAKVKGYPKGYPVYEVMRKLIDSGVYDRDEYMVYSSLKFIEEMSETEKGEKKLNETDLKEDADRFPDLAAEVERGLKATGLTWESDIQAVRGASFTALGKWKKKLEEELKVLSIEKPEGEAWHALVEQKPGLATVNSGKRIVRAWSGKWLDEVLDFPELFEAYPELRNIQMAEDFGMGLADASYSEFAKKHDVSIGKNEGQYPLGFINMNPKSTVWSNERQATSVLLS